MTEKRKRWMRLALTLLALTPGLAAAAGPDPDPAGNWLRANRTVRMTVTHCGSHLCAVNTWVKRPDGPEHAGDQLILDIKPISGTELQGTAYDVRRQLTYRMTVKLQGNSMVTSGCVLLGIICKSTSWTRTD